VILDLRFEILDWLAQWATRHLNAAMRGNNDSRLLFRIYWKYREGFRASRQRNLKSKI